MLNYYEYLIQENLKKRKYKVSYNTILTISKTEELDYEVVDEISYKQLLEALKNKEKFNYVKKVK
jgi:hypothetical protein